MTVYLITNLINGKQYIGQTIHPVEDRWRGHCWDSNDRGILSRAIKKYGKDNFEVREICLCVSRKELDEKEMEYIASYKTLSPNGYNLKTGGNHSEYSEETRAKMSAAKKGKYVPWNKGLTKNDDPRVGTQGAKGSNNRRFGKPSTMLGKKMSAESCEKISKSKMGKKSKVTQKVLDARVFVGKMNSFPIVCSQNGKQYGSFMEAQSDLRLYAGSISKFMSGHLKHVKGYTFKRV